MSTIAARGRVERLVVSKIISVARLAGYALGVYDGERFVVTNSTSRKEILAAMFSVGQEWLYLYKGGKRVAWVFLVYGNDGWDVVCDHSPNVESLLKPAFALADRLSDKYDR